MDQQLRLGLESVTKGTQETSRQQQVKMGSAKLCRFLAVSFLFLTLWTDPTAACSCGPETAFKAYCSSDVVVKLQVLGVTENNRGFWRSRSYRIKVTRVFKGPNWLKRVRTLDISETSDLCFYKHYGPFNKDEYVFTGSRFRKELTTHLCDFHKKWDDLSYEDKRGFEGDFKGACN
ncbi:UNVERIFIED_CONTAM: hypothetical protein K2H54_047646 [Gekko kuhli]